MLIALVVTAGTLFLQGSRCRGWSGGSALPAPDPREDALARAALFEQATAAGLEIARPARTTTTTRSAPWRRSAAGPGSATSPPGSGSAAPTPRQETPSEAYSRLRLEMLAAERAKVLGGAQHRQGARTRSSRTCSSPSTSRSRCSTTATSGAASSRARRRRQRPGSGMTSLRAPARRPRRHRAQRRGRLRGLRRRGRDAPGCTCACASAAATSAAATPPRAATRPPTSRRPATR